MSTARQRAEPDGRWVSLGSAGVVVDCQDAIAASNLEPNTYQYNIKATRLAAYNTHKGDESEKEDWAP